jgi:hypothetical protein
MPMPRIAIDFRPGTTGVLATMIGAVLLTVGLALALTCRPERRCPPASTIIRLPGSVTSALPAIRLGGVIVPPDHADARPWPHGMVLTPPPTPDAINLLAPRVDLGRLVDTVLSALLAPASLVAS